MWCSTLILFYLVTFASAEYFEECSDVAEGTFIAIENECYSYIYCGDKETSFKDACPEDTYFNEETTECVFDDDNICPRNQENEEEEQQEPTTKQPEVIPTITILITPTTTTTTTLKPSESLTTSLPLRPKCDRYVDSYHPHYQRCEYYFKCISGYLTISRCNFSYAWDYHREMCVPNSMAICYGNSKLSNFKNF